MTVTSLSFPSGSKSLVYGPYEIAVIYYVSNKFIMSSGKSDSKRLSTVFYFLYVSSKPSTYQFYLLRFIFF